MNTLTPEDENRDLKIKLSSLKASLQAQTSKCLGLQYKLGELASSLDIYESAFSTLFSNLDLINNSNLYEGITLISDTLQNLLHLKNIAVYFRTLGGKYNKNISLTTYLNADVSTVKYTRGLDLLEILYSLRLFNITKCNSTFVSYLPENKDNYTYTAIECYMEEPVLAVIFSTDLPLSGDMVTLADNLLRIYAIIVQMKRQSMTASMVLNQLSYRLNEAVEVSLTDNLTKINNRTALDKDLAGYFKDCSYTLTMFDIDKFKHINDTFGHQAGDHVLIWFAKQISDFAKELGGMAYRIGGDEFVALFKGDVEMYELVYHSLETLMSTVRQKQFTFSKVLEDNSESPEMQIYSFTTSIGVFFNNNNIPFNEAKKKADTALYASKESGRNTVTKVE